MFGNKITKTILIEGMHCGHCSKRIEEVLKAMNGVKSVLVSLENKKAEVVLKEMIEDDVLQEAIEEIGFEVVEITN